MFTLLIVGVFLFAMETTLDQKGVKFKNYWIYTKTHVTCIIILSTICFKEWGYQDIYRISIHVQCGENLREITFH